MLLPKRGGGKSRSVRKGEPSRSIEERRHMPCKRECDRGVPNLDRKGEGVRRLMERRNQKGRHFLMKDLLKKRKPTPLTLLPRKRKTAGYGGGTGPETNPSVNQKAPP